MRCHNHVEGSKKSNCVLRVTWINVSSNGHLSRAITCFMSSSQLLVSILKHCETFLYHHGLGTTFLKYCPYMSS